MWIAQSPDLLHWGLHEQLLGNHADWANVKIGGGTPPIRTDRGWLSLYHGHIATDRLRSGDIGEYAAATLLQDLSDPRKTLGLSPQPVMRAELGFEKDGYLPNIVFPTAMLHRDECVDVYYGAADTVTGVTRYRLSDLLKTVC
jgi:predicted GH43/DUF377 family glycosyl hydrolase